jgi:hypothetical protein
VKIGVVVCCRVGVCIAVADGENGNVKVIPGVRVDVGTRVRVAVEVTLGLGV